MSWNEDERLAALYRYDILDTPAEADFDDIVRLAADTFGAPIAVVNLIAEGRQWFKAEVGIGARELPLDVSICAHAILQNDTMVVPDTTLDQRFACNPLVDVADGLRFYAGALLKTDEGLPLGTVCVLDRQPRPQGITEHQRRTLEVLARLVMTQLEMRRVITLQHAHATELEDEIRQRRAAETARRAVDDRYRSLFNSLDAGFCIIEMAFDAAGKARDYKFIEVNPAFTRQTGLTQALGKWMRDLVPDHEQHWFDIYGSVATTGEDVRFENPAKALHDRWYDVHAFKVGEAGANLVAVLFNDITERRRAERRRNALLVLGDRLRALDTVAELTGVAAEIVGQTLDVIRVGFGRIDISGAYITVEKDWAADGYASLMGQHSLAQQVDVKDMLDGEQPLVVADVLSTPNALFSRDALDDLGVRSLAVISIPDHDGSTAVFFAQDASPRDWAAADLTFLRNVADRVATGVARLNAEALQRILNLELSHRMKNSLAMVQALASQTLRSVPEREPVDAFISRLQALSTAHSALLQQNWAEARMMEVMQSVLGTLGGIDRFKLDGPPVRLGGRATLSMSLVLHELATNALKYGALSQPSGRVSVTWQVEDGQLNLKWQETGGPAVDAPTRKGFGSRLVAMGLTGMGGAELRYLPAGFQAEFSASLVDVQQT